MREIHWIYCCWSDTSIMGRSNILLKKDITETPLQFSLHWVLSVLTIVSKIPEQCLREMNFTLMDSHSQVPERETRMTRYRAWKLQIIKKNAMTNPNARRSMMIRIPFTNTRRSKKTHNTQDKTYHLNKKIYATLTELIQKAINSPTIISDSFILRIKHMLLKRLLHKSKKLYTHYLLEKNGQTKNR